MQKLKDGLSACVNGTECMGAGFTGQHNWTDNFADDATDGSIALKKQMPFIYKVYAHLHYDFESLGIIVQKNSQFVMQH